MNHLNCVLLVDDNYAINLLHKKIMSRIGVTAKIHVVMNGDEAIKYLDKSLNNGGEGYPKPDLILLDINMPKMNAWEFLEEYDIREYGHQNIVLALLSTSANPDDKTKAAKIPAIADYVQKPLKLKDMEALLNRHFENWKW